jgi:hypothetical protein
MNTNSNSISNLSIKAIEAMARKAAAMAAVTAPVYRAQKRWSQSAPSIEQKISSIHKSLQSFVDENQEAKLEKPTKGSSCKGAISILPKVDESEKKSNVKPIVRYVFYPNKHDLSKIGSVAIYGDDADVRCMQILKRGTLFGYTVASANVEMGRRQFVDVTLVA